MICFLLLLLNTYKVQTPAGIIEVPAEEYVAGVVAGESGELHSDEAIRAMAIAARSYAARMQGRHASQGFDFCSTTHCQRYVAPSARCTKAAQATAGQLLWFNGKPAFCVYSRSCGGKTENVNAVWPDIDAPYLTSHADPYCSGDWNWSASTAQIRQALMQAGLRVPAQLRTISMMRRTASGRAQMLSLDGELVSASSFRFAIGRFIGWSTVRSERYSIENEGDRVVFRGSGEGHGVGLCQLGADQMGLSGKNYREILAFYYPGVAFTANQLHWTRLSGAGVVLYTMQPGEDASVIASAEDFIRKWHRCLPWPPPAQIEIYAYPDLDAFRNSTGEPGWVAARTNGAKIEMQPISVLRSHNSLAATLEHEIVHCFVESAARLGLPVWFREGLVEYLTGHSSQLPSQAPDDAAVRQRTNRDTAVEAYREAAARVQALVRRYGETAVLGWVSRGLPEDVKNSTASQPAVNNK